MSKQSDAKEKQGYVPKAVPKVCMNCASFKFDTRTSKPAFGNIYTYETNLRCGIGGFAVKKMGTCDEWSGKQ